MRDAAHMRLMRWRDRIAAWADSYGMALRAVVVGAALVLFVAQAFACSASAMMLPPLAPAADAAAADAPCHAAAAHHGDAGGKEQPPAVPKMPPCCVVGCSPALPGVAAEAPAVASFDARPFAPAPDPARGGLRPGTEKPPPRAAA